jgi:phage N-6-adenine-methyltransferase
VTNLAVHYSSGKDDWGTPPQIFNPLNAEFGFDLDAAANFQNHKVDRWFGPSAPDYLSDAPDALAVEWSEYAATVWCNPPYSRGLQKKFIAKAAAERLNGITSVLLLPARTDTVAFHSYVWDQFNHQPCVGVEVRFIKGRIKFVGAKHGAPFPSMVVVFRP